MNLSLCTTVIAGPGAGKTHGMVQLVRDTYTQCPTYKAIAVITYTNEATKEISQRLSRTMRMDRNIFIGTIHSFLIRYILLPFGAVTETMPRHCSYIDSARIPFKAKNTFAQKALEIKQATALIEHGYITFDKVLELANQLLSNSLYANAVACRLFALFVDEFQDARILQFDIFKRLLSTNKTKLYVVGDPMQSIFTFTYFQSQLKNEPQPTCETDLPILQFSELTETDDEYKRIYINENRRSSPAIVTFLNRLNKHLQQEYTRQDNNLSVTFESKTDINEIVGTFADNIESMNIEAEEGEFRSLILAKQWSVCNAISDTFGVVKITNRETGNHSLVNEAERCVAGLLCIGIKELREELHITRIEFRKFCLHVLDDLLQKEYADEIHLQNYVRKVFTNRFNISLDTKLKGCTDVFSSLHKLRRSNRTPPGRQMHFSSIHTAKGLQARAVLVIAQTTTALSTWLQCIPDNERRPDERNLGFVAFSRAIDYLCISCLQNSKKMISSIEGLGIRVL